MLENPRSFQVKDPFDRTWTVEFRWLQNAISIRHADAVDLKYFVANDEEKREIVLALPHQELVALAKQAGRALTDSWCLHLGSLHLAEMIRTWEDMDKTIVTLSSRNLSHWNAAYQQALEKARDTAQAHR